MSGPPGNSGFFNNPILAGGFQNQTSPQGGPSWFNRNANSIYGIGSALAPFPASLGFSLAGAANQGSFNPWFGGQQGKIDPGFLSQLGYWSNPGNILGQLGDLFNSHLGLNTNSSGSGYGVPPTMASMNPLSNLQGQGPSTGNNFAPASSPSAGSPAGPSMAGGGYAQDFTGLSGGNDMGPRAYYGEMQPSSIEQYGSMGEGFSNYGSLNKLLGY